MKPDIAELDRAARPREREVLSRLFRGNLRLHVEDLGKPSHRRLAALEEVHDPTERYHRPGQHREVHAERNERSDRDRAVDGERSASSEYDHRAESAKEGKERIERPPKPNERHVERQVSLIERPESLDLRSFLAVSADDARSGQILLCVSC